MDGDGALLIREDSLLHRGEALLLLGSLMIEHQNRIGSLNERIKMSHLSYSHFTCGQI